jgi:GntR family transcriptional regulator, transcriptional repressor for pyruvate dehydrogenase complex
MVMVDSVAPATHRVPVLRVGESLARVLRERILNGEFKDGLPRQDVLVEQFGVSAPSVREAFRVLEAEGLISVRRGNVGGAVVRLPDTADTGYALGLSLQAEGATFHDVAEGIDTIEPLAAMYCAMRPDRHALAVPELTRICEEAGRHLDNAALLAKLASDFHGAIAQFCGNNTIRVMLQALGFLRSTQLVATIGSGDGVASLAEHRDVLADHRKLTEAIAAGNLAAVERLSGRHTCIGQHSLLATPEARLSVEAVRNPA